MKEETHKLLGKAERAIKTGEIDQKYHKWLIEAFNKRLLSDYTFNADITQEKARELIVRAEEFLQVARTYLSK